jgi:Ethanolamine utilization protein EutJ (predicted chaperonin)
MRKLSLTVLVLLSLVVVCPRLGSAQSAAAAVVPAEISADLGTCSALMTVTGSDSKPIYGAKARP